MSETETDAETETTATTPASSDGEPGMGDIFNRDDTKDEVKIGVVLFALVGVGLGVGVLLADVFEDFMFFESLFHAIILAPLIAVLVGQRTSERLEDVPDNLAFGTAGITALAGTVVFGLLVWLFAEIIEDGGDLGDMLLPVIGVGIGAAIAAVGMVWVSRNLID